jgi:hypothetical protein
MYITSFVIYSFRLEYVIRSTRRIINGGTTRFTSKSSRAKIMESGKTPKVVGKTQTKKVRFKGSTY